MKKKVKYILIGTLGLVVILVVLVALFFGGAFSRLMYGPEVPNPEKAKAAMDQIQGKAGQIYSQNKTYSGLSCTYDEVMMMLCRDIEKRIGTKPTFRLLEDKYYAYIKLDVNRYYCIDNTGSCGETTSNPSVFGYCDGTTTVCPAVTD